MQRIFHICVLSLLLISSVLSSCSQSASTVSAPDWPELTSENKVWTRWWWHGNAVTQAGITANLESLQAAGFGGVELTPIFGVIGQEEQFVDYLSEEWVDLLVFTIQEADRLGMEVDIANGTGWPFGGPWVNAEDACKYLAHQTYTLTTGQQLDEKVVYQQTPILRRIQNGALLMHRASKNSGRPYADLDPADVLSQAPRITLEDIKRPITANADLQTLAFDQVRFAEALPLISLMAYSEAGEVLNLTDKLAEDGSLNWTAPAGNWTLYALFQGLHGKMVERAAPGGEGNVIDHFSTPAIQHYLARFDAAFVGKDISKLRAFFNDSYEVDDANGQSNWTPQLLEIFQEKRGYNLLEHLPALYGQADSNENRRVLSDFRETFSDLILETFTQEWDNWAAKHNALIRNQAHGSPANILDLYAASDIPEAEGTQRLRHRFASSAAHVTAKPLVAAEAATWLGEHFTSNWADLKKNLDGYLVDGINHIVYHGTAYSPMEDAWPGRLFYAAFHANDRNSMWDDLQAVNQYVSRVQSLLQKAQADNDILLYFPAYDRFATPGRELLQHFDGHGPHLEESAAGKIGETLLKNGYTFDFISDKQLQATSFQHGIQTAGANYRCILVPPATYMPLTTFQHLLDLAEAGAHIIFMEHLPKSVPGWEEWENRQQQLEELQQKITFSNNVAAYGEGQIILHSNIENALTMTQVKAEDIAAKNLSFNRMSYQDGKLYFIANWSEENFNDWITLSSEGQHFVFLDPMTGQRGLAQSKVTDADASQVRLQLDQGESILIWLTSEPIENIPAWPYYTPTGETLALSKPWTVTFIQGGPDLPPALEQAQPNVWNEAGDDAYTYFSGTGSYSTTFRKPAQEADAWLLDLGKVYETARVNLNGQLIGTLIGPEYRILIDGELLQAENTLSVDVSNRMINRIIKLEQDKVFWKKFYNTNFPPRVRENFGPLRHFSAAKWKPVASGLAGPVRLEAVSYQ